MRTAILKLTLALCIWFPFALSHASKPQIWLSGLDPKLRSIVDPGSPSDFMQLFQPAAPWQKAAAATDVFEAYSTFINYGSDADLTTAFADLKRRHIALGVQSGLLSAIGNCGKGMEGYAAPGAMRALALHIKRDGGELGYLAMDEPFGHGHFANLPNACHSSASVIAADAARKAADIHSIFPNAQIGDIEWLGVTQYPDYTASLMQWVQAYRAAAGRPLAFLQFDIGWLGPWKQQLRALMPQLRAAGVKVGIIYDGDGGDPDSLAWTRDAEQHFADIESDPSLVPDQAIIESWMRFPKNLLPETTPGTLTNLLDLYLAPETYLAVAQTGSTISGRLTGPNGIGEAGQQIQIAALDPTTEQIRTLAATVPQNATHAVFTLSIKADCGCTQTADVTIGTLTYRDPQFSFARAFTQSRYSVPGNQKIQENTASFPVDANSPFTIQVPVGGSFASSNAGYIAIIFLDSTPHELARLRIPLQSASIPLGNVTTDQSGKFMLPANAPGKTLVATFSGSAVLRPAEASSE